MGGEKIFDVETAQTWKDTLFKAETDVIIQLMAAK